MTHCSSCGAEIIWAITERGARMPLDPIPAATGNIQLVGERAYMFSMAQLSKFSDEDKAGLRQTHFVTCPNASRHRSKKATK
jgi:hypothetical protein